MKEEIFMLNKEERKYKKIEDIIIGLFVVFIITTLLVNYFSSHYINEFSEIIQKNIEQRLFTECRALQNMVHYEELEKFVSIEDVDTREYQEILYKLQVYAEEQELMFVYFTRLVDGKVQYIFDSDLNPETHCGLDYFEEPDELMVRAFNGEAVCNLIGEYVEGWEGILSAYLPIYDDNNNLVAIVGVDISDEEIVQRRELAKWLTYASAISTVFLVLTSFLVIMLYRKRAKESNVANIAKSEFLSRMSHEIRTPMNAIIGFCQLAGKTKDIDKKDEFLNSISNSSDYLLQLINNILDISKIEAGKMNLNLEKVSIYRIMKNIEIMLASQVVIKNQKFRISVDKDIPNYVYCDKTRLTQVIVNLTSNAMKFTPEDGNIEITVSLIDKTDKSCTIEFIVKDSGIGIEEKYVSKLFEPFEQGDGGITRKFGGTGLGLAISKLFVEMMQGEISVTSKINKGSSFKFNICTEIVLEKDEPHEDNSRDDIESEAENVDCNGMTFLVVEDNDINQVIAQTVLEGFGATVEIANNGKEGLAKFIENPMKYNIIFMDIQMPVMDGFEATRQIRTSGAENAKEIPIIAMTAEVFQEDVNNSLKAGMNDHLGKPFKVTDLVSIIKKSLNI